MEVKHYQSIASFFKENLIFLEQEEAVNNLQIGISLSLMHETSPRTPLNLFAVFDKDSPVLVCVQTPPKNFLIYGDKPVSKRASEAIIPILIKNKIKASGVIGKKELAITFAEEWQKQSGQKWRINFEQLICQLDQLKEVKQVPGLFRKANMDDLSLLTDWFYEFEKEAMGVSERTTSKNQVKAKIAADTLYLWQDGAAVSMAGVARPTRNGITVNYVYTPLEYRGKGYASNCVAALSGLMLGKYKFCCLFTDAQNPVSNQIYQNMGYYPIAEFREIRFI